MIEPREEPRGVRRRAREAALQMLYQWEIGKIDPAEVIRSYGTLERADVSKTRQQEVSRFAEELVNGTIGRLEAIDPLIAEQAQHWRLERMATMDRLILRLAVYEMLAHQDRPAKIVINEAVELAKRFSSEDAAGFVNGVLDGIRRRLEADAEAGR